MVIVLFPVGSFNIVFFFFLAFTLKKSYLMSLNSYPSPQISIGCLCYKTDIHDFKYCTPILFVCTLPSIICNKVVQLELALGKDFLVVFVSSWFSALATVVLDVQ